MSEEGRTGNLEIDQDLDFQRRAWIAQRLAWVVLALIILAALLGFFGSGPLSRRTVGGAGIPLRLVYNRYERYTAPTSLQFHAEAGAESNSELRVWIARDYLHGVQIQSVTPLPYRVEAGTDRLIYVFKTASPNQPTVITFNLTTQKIGWLSGRAGLEGEQSIEFEHFVYP